VARLLFLEQLPTPEDCTEEKSKPGGDRDRYERTVADGIIKPLVGVAKRFAAGRGEIV